MMPKIGQGAKAVKSRLHVCASQILLPATSPWARHHRRKAKSVSGSRPIISANGLISPCKKSAAR